MAKPLRTAEHLKMIDERLGHFEAKVDERFEQVDKRFADQRSHFDSLAEAARDQFRNLYDLMTAQAQKTDDRLNQIETEIRVGMRDMQAALHALVPGVAARRSRKRVS